MSNHGVHINNDTHDTLNTKKLYCSLPYFYNNNNGVRMMMIMEWVKKRVVEPTSWLAIGVGAVILSMMMPSWSIWFWCVAGATVVAGIVMKERG